jgi:alpha-tubulin suppressor-like RCC1 family protein
MPAAYAEVAKRSANKDELLKAGSRLIKTRGSAFQIVEIACGARHTLALSSSHELFSWGSGCCGQLGHGGRHDEMLPRPLDAFKSRGLKAQGVRTDHDPNHAP